MSLRKKLKISLEGIASDEIAARVKADGEESELDSFDGMGLAELDNEVTQDLDQLEEISIKVNSLEGLCVALESLSYDDRNSQLAACAYNQIMAGTNLGEVSMESPEMVVSRIRESVKAFAKKTSELLAHLWTKLKELLRGLYAYVPRKIKALEQLKAKVSEISDDSFNGDVSVSAKTLDAFSPGNGHYTFNDMLKAIRVLQKESAWYLTEYMGELKRIRDKLEHIENVQEIPDILAPHYDTMMKRYPVFVEDDYLLGSSDYLIGGFLIKTRIANIKDDVAYRYRSDSEKVAAVSSEVFNTKVRLVHQDKVDHRPEKMPVFSKQEILQLLDEAITQLSFVEKHRDTYIRMCDDMEARAHRWINRELIQSAQSNLHKTTDWNLRDRQARGFAVIADWTKEPTSGLLSLSIRFGDAVGTYVKKCANLPSAELSNNEELMALAALS